MKYIIIALFVLMVTISVSAEEIRLPIEEDIKLLPIDHYDRTVFETTKRKTYEICPPIGEQLIFDGLYLSMDYCVDGPRTPKGVLVAFRLQINDNEFFNEYIWCLFSSSGIWTSTRFSD